MKLNCFMLKCHNSWEIIIEVLVIHKSGRKTWQIWKLCKKCFLAFIQKKGIGYYREYSNGNTAVVIGFRIDFLVYDSGEFEEVGKKKN